MFFVRAQSRRLVALFYHLLSILFRLRNEFSRTEIVIAGRVFIIHEVMQVDDNHIGGHELMYRAERLGDNLTSNDLEHILRYQKQLPTWLRPYRIVFTQILTNPGDRTKQRVTYLHWMGHWYKTTSHTGNAKWYERNTPTDNGIVIFKRASTRP